MSNFDGVDSVSYHLQPHVALLPSAGMGHLTPCLRLAASLAHLDCRVTLITSHPTVSLAESQSISSFLSAFPQVTEKQFHLLPLDPTSLGSDDPFFLQWEAINRSARLLPPLLSSISPISAFVTDVTLVSSVVPLTADLGVPNYILFVSSARMCSFFMSFPTFVASKTTSGFVTLGNNKVEIPISSIPPPLLDLNHPFATSFLQNAQGAMKSTGVLINTFKALEGDVLHALNDTRQLIDGFLPLHAIGPLLPGDFEKREDSAPVKWLDDQPDGSVVYVSFGSRSALSREQMKELGNGLVRSGCKFLWVVKDKKVDKEDGESLDELLGSELMERIEDQGLVVQTWVDQNEILSHRGVGGFLSHCGWNSVLEAAWHGMRVLMWPLGGDQKINAEVVERSGLGVWVKSWGWNDQQVVIKAEEIGQGIKDMMENNQLKIQAAKMKEEARKAVGIGGSSERTLKGLIQEWKKNNICNICENIIN